MNHVRNDFPFLKHIINKHPLCYLDNAATTQKPDIVLKTMDEFYTDFNANIYRGMYAIAEQATQSYEHARQIIAHFFNVDAAEIIFTKGTTEGINAIAATWAEEYIRHGDTIVLTELEHHANILPWQRVAKRKQAQLVYIPVTADGYLDYSNLDRYITKKTKLVSITHCSNVLGTQVDLKPIINAAKAVGATVMVDGAQSAPQERINIRELGIDFFACSGHKLLGPTGVGILYINKRLHDSIPPYQLGGGMVQQVSWHDAQFRGFPFCFEAGTPPIAQAIGLGAAIEYLTNNIDFKQLRMHEAQLCTQLIDGLSAYQSIKVLGPIEQLKRNGHIVSFIIDGFHAHDVAAFLDNYGIAVRAGNHCAQPLLQKLGLQSTVRASFYIYNIKQEIDHMLEAIDDLLNA